jgi:tRNA-Thr(GGU) m(6)t(6)A37 methyltransferase TsaA
MQPERRARSRRVNAAGSNQDIVVKPIGVLHTPFTELNGMPIQPVFSRAVGRVEVYREYAEGLRDVEGFSYVILIYALHRSEGFTLRVKPFLDDVERGVFSTRHPRRPNPIGLSIVRLLSCRDCVLEVEGIDVLDGTPLLDIKPYVPDFDVKMDAKAGWYDGRPAGKDEHS